LGGGRGGSVKKETRKKAEKLCGKEKKKGSFAAVPIIQNGDK